MSDELAEGERTFLHDISNQLVVAQGMGTFILNSIEKRIDGDVEDKEFVRMTKTLNAINKMVDLVKSRREVVKSQEPKIG
jgi:hypothetical protein